MLEIPALTTSKPKPLRVDRRSQAANLACFLEGFSWESQGQVGLGSESVRGSAPIRP